MCICALNGSLTVTDRLKQTWLLDDATAKLYLTPLKIDFTVHRFQIQMQLTGFTDTDTEYWSEAGLGL